MEVHVETTALKDAVIISNEIFEDDRGFFMEVYRKDIFEKAGLPTDFVQLNHSRSTKGVVRGLHFQWEPPMGKLIRVTQGTAYLTAVDIRKGSPTFGQWIGMEFDAKEKKQFYAPAGFARGFCCLSDVAELEYLTTGTYNGSCEASILWNDPEIGMEWPISNPTLSERDINALTLSQWMESENSNHFIYSQ